MTRNWVEAPQEKQIYIYIYICVCVCVCVYLYVRVWGVKMSFVRLYSMRLQQLHKIIRPSLQNVVRICMQIITVTFCEASNRLAILKFVNSSTQILVIVVPTYWFTVTDFISYILPYLYLTNRPILITYSHSNQCNLAWFIWSNKSEYPPWNQCARHFHWQ
jgi:hypothetical protein